MYKNRKGFTLLEVLIAIFLLTVGLLAAASMQTIAVENNGVANRHTAATSVAQMVMDDLLSVPIQLNLIPNYAFNPQALPPFPDWYAVFTLLGMNGQAAPGNWRFVYNRFPPFNGNALDPQGLGSYTFYSIPGSGNFRASFSTTLHTPTQNITQIQVFVFICDGQGNVNLNSPVITLTNYRKIPAS